MSNVKHAHMNTEGTLLTHNPFWPNLNNQMQSTSHYYRHKSMATQLPTFLLYLSSFKENYEDTPIVKNKDKSETHPSYPLLPSYSTLPF